MKESINELESKGLTKLVTVEVRSTLHLAPRQDIYISGLGLCKIDAIINATQIRVKAKLSFWDRLRG
jgi:hypothetical protein